MVCEGVAVLNDGYTPLFSSLTTGTLCGRWPDIGLWAIVLSMADWRGVIDATPQYISSVTGLAVEDVKGCMRRFCEPDPDSRSKAEQGARLALVDPERDWGWRVINIQLYRDKASGRDQITDGRNAEKVRRYKERHRQTPVDTGRHSETPPDTNGTPTHTQTQTETQTQTREEPPLGTKGVQGEMRAARAPTARRLPDGFELTEDRKAIARKEGADPEREFAKFSDHWLAASGSNARKHDWDAAWRNWCRKAGEFKPKNGGATEAPKLTWRPPPDDGPHNVRK
jgi:hypothetical protein